MHSVLFWLIRYARAEHASFATIVKRNKWSRVKMRRHKRNKHRGQIRDARWAVQVFATPVKGN